jgi:hypothetical protein
MSAILQSLGIERGVLVLLCALALWLVVIICVVTSVLSQPFTSKQKKTWIMAILGIPIFGLMAYLPFSIRKDNHPFLFQAKKH